jgi:hypothetical protein
MMLNCLCQCAISRRSATRPRKIDDGPESSTRVLSTLLEAIQSGPNGIAQASNTLMDGIEWAYLYTAARLAQKAVNLVALCPLHKNSRVAQEHFLDAFPLWL